MKKTVLILALIAPSGLLGGPTDCYCTDKTGARVELGETRCMSVGGRVFMARCEMSLNVPMWREQTQGCVGA